MVSDRAVFVHRAYLDSFGDVADNNDCQLSVGLSIHSTAVSQKPPIAMKANPQDLVVVPSSSSSSRQDKTRCLEDWLEGHALLNPPQETMRYLGQL